MSKRKSQLIATLVALMSTCVLVATSAAAEESAPPSEASAATSRPSGDAGSPGRIRSRFALDAPVLAKNSESALYIVRLAADPITGYLGGVPGLAATSKAAGVDPGQRDAAEAAYRGYLDRAQTDFTASASRALGRAAAVEATFHYADNAVAMRLSHAEAAAVAKLPGVIAVAAMPERHPLTDESIELIRADDTWSLDPAGPALTTRGEGMVVGVIDTGISPYNPQFADPAPAPNAYDHTNPLGAGNYLGVCATGNWQLSWGTFPCNDKLIGIYDFRLGGDGDGLDGPGYDLDGHGTHTSSTAGGNSVTASPYGQPLDISGVAPRANVIMYRGCCGGDGLDLATAIEFAVEDGFNGVLDVINYSVGSTGAGNPYADFDAVNFFYARMDGVFVAVSNGNDGPGDHTTGSPASAPWVTSVGASATQRTWEATLTLPVTSGTDLEFTAEAAADTVSAPIVDAADVGDPQCLDSAGHEAAFAGKIVLCERGSIPFVTKGANVGAQGAVGVIAFNNVAGAPVAVTFPIPGLYISNADGLAVRAWLDTVDGTLNATIDSTTVIDAAGREDVIADFSSRGPNDAVDVVNPNLVAPGVEILAATAEFGTTNGGVAWATNSGTSMASPHVAGAAALVLQSHPTWTPSQVQSALMTTSKPIVRDLDLSPANPSTQGSGRIDVYDAVHAGLLFDVPTLDYVSLEARDLNIPSFADNTCIVECSWERVATVPATAPTGVVWTVDPDQEETAGLVVDASLDDSVAGTIAISVTADVRALDAGDVANARVTLEPSWSGAPAGDLPPSVTLPLVVTVTNAELPTELDIHTRRDAGSETFAVTSIGVTQFDGEVLGLVEAEQHLGQLPADATNGDPFDGGPGVAVHLLAVPAGGDRLAVDVIDTTMSDLDLYVGWGDTPSLDTLVCQSATSGSVERCSIELLPGDEGDWWVLVQNWEASDVGATDTYTVATAVVPAASAANATLVGPAGPVAELTPYEARFVWSGLDAEAGSVWYGTAVLASDPAAPGDLGEVPVRLTREADDVTIAASTGVAEPGDTVGYTITIAPNITGTDLTYDLSTEVPDGLVIDPATITGGGVAAGQTITWGDVPVPAAGVDAVTLQYSVTVAADAPAGTATTTVTHVTNDPFAAPDTAAVDVTIAPAMLQPVPPKRLFDTRPTEPQGAIDVAKHTYGGTDVLKVNLLGVAGISPDNVAAVALNVTAVDPAGPGYVTVYPCNEQRPLVSNINFQGPGVYPNAVIAPVSADGELCLYSKVQTHLIADVVGWFPEGAGIGTVTPTRLFDTRATEPNGSIVVTKTPIGGEGNILKVKIAGVSGVPSTGAAAVALNVTAVNPVGPGYVTVYPCNDTRPFVSNVNFQGPGVYPNAVVAPLSPDGEVCFYSKVDTDLIADVNAWFPADAGFGPVTPVRLFDTRTTEPNGLITVDKKQYGGDANILTVKVTGIGGVPEEGVGIVSLNVTAVNPTGPGYVTVYPCGPRPVVSNVNFMGPGVYPNAVLTPVSDTGEVCFFSKVPTDLIADVNGWFAAP